MFEGNPRLVAHEEFSGNEEVCVIYSTDVLKEIKKLDNKENDKDFDNLIKGEWVDFKKAVKVLNYISKLNCYNELNDIKKDLDVLYMTILRLNKSSHSDYYDLLEECGKNYNKFKLVY